MQTRQNSAKPVPGVSSAEITPNGALNTVTMEREKQATLFDRHWELYRAGLCIRIYYGNSIAFVIRSFDPSLSSQLITCYPLV